MKVDIPNKKTADGGDYWKVNPKGYVPTLVLDDGQAVTEVGMICQYLADQKPESGLVDEHPENRREQMAEHQGVHGARG